MRLGAVVLIVPLALVILAAPLAAEAQPAGKAYRIGYLSTGSAPGRTTPDPADALWQRLRELGPRGRWERGTVMRLLRPRVWRGFHSTPTSPCPLTPESSSSTCAGTSSARPWRWRG